jgi:6-pyruvoyl-tetrahydropterin synthase
MKITRTFWFSMGRALRGYEGKCANLHGHNYRLMVTVES